MTAPKAPPREVWVVVDGDGEPHTAWGTADGVYLENSYTLTLHRYVLEPATERERTGQWVIRGGAVREQGKYLTEAGHWSESQKRAFRYNHRPADCHGSRPVPLARRATRADAERRDEALAERDSLRAERETWLRASQKLRDERDAARLMLGALLDATEHGTPLYIAREQASARAFLGRPPRPVRAKWQCSGCSTRFETFRKTCPQCGREGYLSGSVDQSLGLFVTDAEIDAGGTGRVSSGRVRRGP